jgi:hypothetical protein
VKSWKKESAETDRGYRGVCGRKKFLEGKELWDARPEKIYCELSKDSTGFSDR